MSDAIINPKKNIAHNEDGYLCATTLTYFFLDCLIKNIGSDFKINNYLIFVLLATICDVMPLRKINKIIASNVIKGFKINDNPVFRELAPESAVKFNASDEISIADTIINLNKMENEISKLIAKSGLMPSEILPSGFSDLKRSSD